MDCSAGDELLFEFFLSLVMWRSQIHLVKLLVHQGSRYSCCQSRCASEYRGSYARPDGEIKFPPDAGVGEGRGAGGPRG